MRNLFNKLPLIGRLTLLISGGTALILLATIIYSHIGVKATFFEKTSHQNRIITENIAERIQLELIWTEGVLKSAADQIRRQPFSKDFTQEVMSRTLLSQPHAFGMALALAPETDHNAPFKILYGYRKDNRIDQFTLTERDNIQSDYQSDWFYLPYYLGKPVWVDPYYDPFAETAMVTYCYPIKNSEGQVMAVLTCDLTTEFISKLIDRNQMGENGTPFIVTREGVFTAHPNPDYVRKESMFSLSEDSAYRNAGLEKTAWDLGRRLVTEDSGFITYHHPENKRPVWMHFQRIPAVGGAAGVFFTERQMIEETVALNHVNMIMAIFGVAFLTLFGLMTAISIARPLKKLSEIAVHLSTGDFKFQIPKIKGSREIIRLGNAFVKMRDDLQNHVKQLTAATAAKEKIASELSIARDIQMGIVPKLFPPFPDHPSIDLYAKLDPALEVGGDLYDFALLDENHIYIAIGDVSGKGVPASLLMAVGKTLLKSAVIGYQNPAKAVTITNQEMSEHNDACMFITLFCGILDIATGELIYVNAGHNPPLIYRTESEKVEILSTCHGPAVGVVPGIEYEASSVILGPADLLLLYTDGITEAMNTQMQIYSDERLIEWVSKHGKLSSTDLILRLYDDVHDYAAGMEQWDDMTTLAIRGCSSDPMSADSASRIFELHVNNSLSELPGIQRWLETCCIKAQIPLQTLAKLQFIAEEWFVNIISYAYPDSHRTQQITLRLWHTAEEVFFRSEDGGIPFDPLSYTPDSINTPLEERRIGGLGIRFIIETADRILYERTGNQNLITFVKTIIPALNNSALPVRTESQTSNRLLFREESGITVVEMPIQIDVNSAAEIEHQLLQAILNGKIHLTCDFSKTHYISSAGLRVMLLTAKKARFAQGSLSLIHLPPEVYAPFTLAGFDQIMEVTPSLSDGRHG